MQKILHAKLFICVRFLMSEKEPQTAKTTICTVSYSYRALSTTLALTGKIPFLFSLRPKGPQNYCYSYPNPKDGFHFAFTKSCVFHISIYVSLPFHNSVYIRSSANSSDSYYPSYLLRTYFHSLHCVPLSFFC